MRESSTVPVCGSTAVTVNGWPSKVKGRLPSAPSDAATSAPTSASSFSSVSMTRLRTSVFLSSLGRPANVGIAPQPIGREKMPAPAQAALAWNSLLGRMPVSVKADL